MFQTGKKIWPYPLESVNTGDIQIWHYWTALTSLRNCLSEDRPDCRHSVSLLSLLLSLKPAESPTCIWWWALGTPSHSMTTSVLIHAGLGLVHMCSALHSVLHGVSKIDTLQSTLTFSNLNWFSKSSHCWEEYEISHKRQKYHQPHLKYVAASWCYKVTSTVCFQSLHLHSVP